MTTPSQPGSIPAPGPTPTPTRVRPIDHFTSDTWREALERAVVRDWERGAYLFHEGDRGDGLYVIDAGYVAIRRAAADGHENTLTILGPGEAFGEQALLRKEALRTASAVAVVPTRTRMLPSVEFARLRDESPALDRFLIDVLAAQVRRLSEQLVDALHTPAEPRVVRRLLMLAPVFSVEDHADAPGNGSADGPADRPGVRITIRQDELASMVGLTRQTVNTVLRTLAEDGLVELSWGTIAIPDLDRLAPRAAGSPPKPGQGT